MCYKFQSYHSPGLTKEYYLLFFLISQFQSYHSPGLTIVLYCAILVVNKFQSYHSPGLTLHGHCHARLLLLNFNPTIVRV